VPVYEVEKFCHRLTIDSEYRAAALADLAGVLARFDMSPVERDAILTGDVGFLLGHGVHPLLLVRLCRAGIAGLTEASYSERIRLANGSDS
jgi:hypothetical protein